MAKCPAVCSDGHVLIQKKVTVLSSLCDGAAFCQAERKSGQQTCDGFQTYPKGKLHIGSHLRATYAAVSPLPVRCPGTKRPSEGPSHVLQRRSALQNLFALGHIHLAQLKI